MQMTLIFVRCIAAVPEFRSQNSIATAEENSNSTFLAVSPFYEAI